MNQRLSRIHNLYCYEDGDHIDARMGVQLDNGYALAQYWDTVQGKVVNTDFTQHSPVLYPFPYSSKRGQVVVPATQGQQWYYNNPETETAGILDEHGNVKSAYSSLFEVTTITVNGSTFPALRIKGNLATANDLTDKHIYYKSTCAGKPFTASILIPIQTTVGESTKLEVFLQTADGSGSNVLSNTNAWVQLTAALQRAGTTIASGVTYQWQKLVNGQWQNVTNQQGTVEVISSSVIKVYNPGVDTEDLYRVAATYDNTTTYKTQQLTDEADPFYIYDGCSQAGDAVPAGTDVSFTPVVYDRITNQPDTANTWSFSFYMFNMVTTAAVGTVSTTVPFVVPYATLEQNQGLQVVIVATNE